MAYGGWTLCGRDLRNGFHEGCVQALVFAKEIDEEIGRRKDVPQYTWYCSRAARGRFDRRRLDFVIDFVWAAEATMARVTAVGDGYEYDGVVVGHPVIQFGDGAPPAVVGYPLPKEPPPPPPPATLQRGRPEQRCSSRCGPCEIFTVTFMVVVAVESLTYFLLAMIGMASVTVKPVTDSFDPDDQSNYNPSQMTYLNRATTSARHR
uniref:p0696G06.5 protein n=1 Tax=Oryza sativa subsp. japonica TaxID=39947 RepID=Q7F449_ORYSJ|nr:P0696G06.5 [Oryza sativa Japonica Group]